MTGRILKRSVVLLFLLIWLGLPKNTLQATVPVKRTVLPNGLVLLVKEEHSLPFVTCHLLIDAGSWRDPRGEEGSAYLTAKALLSGTSKRSSTSLYEEVDFMGASLRASSGKDYATLTLRVLKKHLDEGLDLFMESLTQPTFPEVELRREVKKALAALESAEEQPGQVAQKAFREALFQTSPYLHAVEGTKESLPKLTREKILGFYHAFYHPNSSILAVVGDLTAAEVHKKLLPQLARWSKGQIPKMKVNTLFAKGPKLITIDRALSQANIILGHSGVSRDNPDFYELTVMNYILGGGGFASRLVEEIREKRGLSYSVASFFVPGRYPGSFRIVLQTKNASAQEALTVARRQMERMRKELVSEEELQAAKRYLVGSFPLRLGTQRKLADLFTRIEYYGLGLDYPERYPALISSVTREAVLRVAQKYLHPENSILVVIGDLQEAGFN